MNNEFLKELSKLMDYFKELYKDDFFVGDVCLEALSDYGVGETDSQTADDKHHLLEDFEYVLQSGGGETGDCFEGVLVRPIKDTEYALVLEYST